MAQKDVFLNIAGGIRVTDPAIDLSVIASVLSSNVDTAIERNVCMAGEVGLSGEIRPVTRIAQRIAEAEKLGFSRFILPDANLKGLEGAKRHIELFPSIALKKPCVRSSADGNAGEMTYVWKYVVPNKKRGPSTKQPLSTIYKNIMQKTLTLRVLPQIAAQDRELRRYVAGEMAIDARTICDLRIRRRSIDARQRTIMSTSLLRSMSTKRRRRPTLRP